MAPRAENGGTDHRPDRRGTERDGCRPGGEGGTGETGGPGLVSPTGSTGSDRTDRDGTDGIHREGPGRQTTDRAGRADRTGRSDRPDGTRRPNRTGRAQRGGRVRLSARPGASDVTTDGARDTDQVDVAALHETDPRARRRLLLHARRHFRTPLLLSTPRPPLGLALPPPVPLRLRTSSDRRPARPPLPVPGPGPPGPPARGPRRVRDGPFPRPRPPAKGPRHPRSTSACPATTSTTCSHSAANAAFSRPSSSR